MFVSCCHSKSLYKCIYFLSADATGRIGPLPTEGITNYHVSSTVLIALFSFRHLQVTDHVSIFLSVLSVSVGGWDLS